jgi:hypothetical protein
MALACIANSGVVGNGATFYLLVFAILAGVVGAASNSKLAGVHHIRAWRHDSMATNAASSLIAYAITVLAFGLACKEIHVGGHRRPNGCVHVRSKLLQ